MYLLFLEVKSIFARYMAGVEWGPRNIPTENRKLLEVTRFSGGQLREVESNFRSYLQRHPMASRDEIVLALSQNEKQAARMQAGLDVLNQIYITGRNGQDIQTVVVRQDLDNSVPAARAGAGKPYYWYEIDWIREPEPRSPIQAQPSPSSNKTIYPFRSNADRDAERVSRKAREREERLREAAAARERMKKLEEKKAKRVEIDKVVIDRVKEAGDSTLELGQVKIETSEDGVASILYSEFGYITGRYYKVDRRTGRYFPFSSYPDHWESINAEFLDYFNILAQQAEGKEITYSPVQLDTQVYEDAYQCALSLGMIQAARDKEKGVVFHYDRNPESEIRAHVEMDLEREIVETGGIFKRKRPINPHFANLLRRKKAELEAQKV